MTGIQYKNMLAYVKDYLKKTSKYSFKARAYPFRNKFDHTMRVLEWARRINKVEKGDNEVLEIAVIFHDVGKYIASSSQSSHGEIGAEICEKYFQKENICCKKLEKILQAIEIHSDKHLSAKDLNLEEKILMDADLLDEVGTMSLMWESMIAGKSKEPSYYKVYDYLLARYQEVKSEARLLKTKTGRNIYNRKVALLGLLLKDLEHDLALTTNYSEHQLHSFR